MSLDAWWVWAVAAIVLAVGEVILPSYVLLGFAAGAAALALILGVGGPLAGWLAGSLGLMLLVFALLSLAAWVILRRVLGPVGGSVKTFDRDINDD